MLHFNFFKDFGHIIAKLTSAYLNTIFFCCGGFNLSAEPFLCRRSATWFWSFFLLQLISSLFLLVPPSMLSSVWRELVQHLDADGCTGLQAKRRNFNLCYLTVAMCSTEKLVCWSWLRIMFLQFTSESTRVANKNLRRERPRVRFSLIVPVSNFPTDWCAVLAPLLQKVFTWLQLSIDFLKLTASLPGMSLWYILALILPDGSLVLAIQCWQ